MLILLLVILVFYTGALSPHLWRAVQQEARVTYSDPFAYCKAVKNIDAPGDRYVGPKLPESIVRGLQVALQVPRGEPLPPPLENSFWRCMDRKVYGCTVGANLPCMTKANTSREPSEAVVKFCAVNRDVSGIPMVVTGRATVYAWRCEKGRPLIVRESVKPDARGFLSNIWYEIVKEPGEVPAVQSAN